MGLFSFLKDAGKKIFGGGDDAANQAPDTAKQADAIKSYIEGMNVPVKNLAVNMSEDGTLSLSGDTDSIDDYEKIALLAGNIYGVSTVNNEMTVNGETALQGKTSYHTVESGDTLWKISEKYYNDGNKYTMIVEANQPMIKDADEIYPGQVLRVPATEA